MIIKIYIIVLLIMLFLPYTFYAQGENNIWVLDEGIALDFNQSPPEVIGIPIPSIIDTAIFTLSVSDANGDLLFYCLDDNLYDRNGKITPNGRDFISRKFREDISINLQEHISVRSLTNPDQYYLFTVDFKRLTRRLFGTLRYTLIDMSLNNGLGDVVGDQNGVILLDTITTHMTVAYGVEDELYLLCHKNFTNEFISIPINDNGIGEPIITPIGPIFYEFQLSFWGDMVYNPYRNIIAIKGGSTDFIPTNPTERHPPFIELYCFDRTSGKLSNRIIADTSKIITPFYDISISPDGTKLYSLEKEKVLQFDISLLDESAIHKSRKQIYTFRKHDTHGSSQVGPDGKLYILSTYSSNGLKSDLCVLKNPNADWSELKIDCNTHTDQLTDLRKKNISLFLPTPMLLPRDNNVTQPVPTQLLTIPGDTLMSCNNENITLSIDPSVNYLSLLWSTGDTSSSISPDIDTGLVWVEIDDGSCHIIRDSIYVMRSDMLPVDIGPDHTICGAKSIALYPASSTAEWSYEWSTGSTDDTIYVTEGGTYTLSVSTGGCMGSDSVEVVFAEAQVVSIIGDTILCPDEIITLSTEESAASYMWSTDATTREIMISESGVYSVKVTDSDGCTAVDQIVVTDKANCDCNIYIPNALSISSANDNNSWRAVSNCAFSSYELTVYDRWGGEVYRTINPADAWSGTISSKLATSGVYAYLLRYQFNTNEPISTLAGDLTVVR